MLKVLQEVISGDAVLSTPTTKKMCVVVVMRDKLVAAGSIVKIDVSVLRQR
jgi:hypothetical protein